MEEKAFKANMELLGVIESERNAIRKRHAWKLLEEQDRVLRSYYSQREGFDRGGHGTQGQTGLCKKTNTKNGLVMQEPGWENGATDGSQK